tara:strand:- start:2505 stop:3158 length:654 start_codon:yes stop_codon:yes gene_type:complete
MPHKPGHKDKRKSSDGTTPQEAMTAILDLFRQVADNPINNPMGALTSSNIFANPEQNLNPNLPSPQAIDRNFMDNFLLRDRQGAMLPATFLDALVDRIMERVQSEGGPMNESLQNLMNIMGARTGNFMDDIMKGLMMQSGVPGRIGQPSFAGPPMNQSPSLPNRNPSFDLGPPPAVSPQQIANFAQRSTPQRATPVKRRVQTAQQIQPRPQTYTPGM